MQITNTSISGMSYKDQIRVQNHPPIKLFFAKSTDFQHFSHNFTLLRTIKGIKTVEHWLNHHLAMGRNSFALADIKRDFPSHSDLAIKSSLKRLVDKGQIKSILKGYYLILPPAYQSRGALPPSMFLDDMMQALDRPYYLALLSAAAYHGAGHQQPQTFFVVTSFPVMRTTIKKGIQVEYISTDHFSKKHIERVQTESGYLSISNPLLTALDLIQYSKHIGGINRAATVLSELVEKIQPSDFQVALLRKTPVTVLQRLGYLLENELGEMELAQVLFQKMQRMKIEWFRAPLNVSKPLEGCPTSTKWKVVINTSISID